LPHLSTKIESFGSDTLDASNLKRVIVGFNVFLHDIGPIVQNAPEHSHVFNQKVKMQRMQRRRRQQQQQNDGGDRGRADGGSRLSLQALQSNPQLAKLLVLAKRQKVKQDLCQAQAALTQHIVALLLAKQQADAERPQPQEEDEDEDIRTGLPVAILMQQSCRENSNNISHNWSSSSLVSFPTPVDVQVHVHHLCRQGVLQIVLSPDHDASNNDSSSSDHGSTSSRRNNSRGCDLISPNEWVRFCRVDKQPVATNSTVRFK
jgi:hypothetical protein